MAYIGLPVSLKANSASRTSCKLAHGAADNLLTVSALAYGGREDRPPLVVAPAMDGGMWTHPATQENIQQLQRRGVRIAGPERGRLASGLVAQGRMVEPEILFGEIRRALAENGPLNGTAVLVSAGGTQEAIDPVRYITNRSSGKQGYALAQAALDLGASVTLIAAPNALPTPYGARLITVRSAAEMLDAVQAEVPNHEVLIMAAAVADFRPAEPAAEKIKKENGLPRIDLAATADILKSIPDDPPGRLRLRVGFAAESENLLANAQAKLAGKNLDLIVANDIGAPDAGFEVDTNRVSLLFADGRREDLPLLSKDEVAQRVVMEIAGLLEKGGPADGGA